MKFAELIKVIPKDENVIIQVDVDKIVFEAEVDIESALNLKEYDVAHINSCGDELIVGLMM